MNEFIRKVRLVVTKNEFQQLVKDVLIETALSSPDQEKVERLLDEALVSVPLGDRPFVELLYKYFNSQYVTKKMVEDFGIFCEG